MYRAARVWFQAAIINVHFDVGLNLFDRWHELGRKLSNDGLRAAA
jgi:hypothetical protein